MSATALRERTRDALHRPTAAGRYDTAHLHPVRPRGGPETRRRGPGASARAADPR